MQSYFSSERRDSVRWIMLVCLTAILALALGACATATDAPTDVPPSPVPPTDVPPTPEPTPLPDQSAFIAAVEGNMMNTYDLGHGPNEWCTRCHSPQNWDPAAFQGPPPSCFTCKFDTDEELRIAEGNPYVPEEEWIGVPCMTCHVVDENGIAGELAWYNPIKEDWQEVNTSTELCEKCHVTTTGNAFGSAVDHQITFGGSAHLNYGGFLGDLAPPTYCADCHDPHTLEPKQCEECHADVLTSDTHMKGYNAIMLDKLTCMACHDASGADSGPPPDDPEGKPPDDPRWVNLLTTMGRGGPSTDVVVSHSIVYTVACDRCHSKENAFGLSTLDAGGDPLEETICLEGETTSVLYDDLGDYGEVDVDYTVGECPTTD